jgi:DNA excision repair protein ERCC-4
MKLARPTRHRNSSDELPAFQGALITATVVFGLPVLRSRDPDETARLIVYAADQLQPRRSRPPRRFGFKTTGLRQHQLSLLQAVPEIGGSKAKLLLETFKGAWHAFAEFCPPS